jgi:hypothetical protein
MRGQISVPPRTRRRLSTRGSLGTITLAIASIAALGFQPATAATPRSDDDLRATAPASTTQVRLDHTSQRAQSWQQTWSAPGNSLSEWRSLQMPADPPARLSIVAPPRTKNGTALRAEVRDGDVALNPHGAPIRGGWRAEAIGPQETASTQPVRYEWSTLLDAAYPMNPTGTDGKSIWQVITQWHQGDADVGGPPPIALVLVRNEIRLHLHQSDPTNPDGSVEIGQYPVATLDCGNWHDFRLEIRWALSGGYVKVWHNERLAADIQDVPTLFPTRKYPSTPGTVYLKMGLYRKASTVGMGPFVLYHDEARRLQTR